MTAFELKFTAGRFHATPWGRHVNEGSVEWPPSPWRILRALIATWHWKAKADVPEPLIRSLAAKLAQQPRFFLPPATTAHTRHYMPLVEGKKEKTTKVFDTFIQLAEDSAVLVAWDVDLPDAERAALKILAERLAYFGRAESLVIARVFESEAEFRNAITPRHREASPIGSTDPLPPGHELVRLLAPMISDRYDAWRADFAAKALADLGPKPTAAQKKKLPAVPADLFAALHADTGDLQASGWNLPPGARFVNYTRPENAFAPAAKPRPRRSGAKLTVARFALASVVPPAITKALAVAEQLHDVLCKESNGHPIFTGAESEGHRHAHIFCESIGDPTGHITHVTIYAAGGYDHQAVEALRKLQWTWGFKGHELRTVLHGVGQVHEFASPLFSISKKWRSLTPFVSTRHAKTFRDGHPKVDDTGWQPGSAPHDLLRLLKTHPHGQGAEIRLLAESSQPYRFGNRRFRSLQFLTRRNRGEGRRGHDSGAALEIAFPEPRPGPFALGYASHFGLGLFLPIDHA
jgi:CRISPR-associated protein Csb2